MVYLFDIIHVLFLFNKDVSEPGLCLRPQIGSDFVEWTHLSRLLHEEGDRSVSDTF
jgi:hypothetical protein